jgi:hypothetical protein
VKRLLITAIVGVLTAGSSSAVFAQSATDEVSTAHAHALMAQSATTVAAAHMHLHHVINCIVGATGSDYDAAAGTPCKGQGDGALKDAASNSTLEGKLNVALADARSGLKSDALSTVQQDAAKAAGALGATTTQKASGGYKW